MPHHYSSLPSIRAVLAREYKQADRRLTQLEIADEKNASTQTIQDIKEQHGYCRGIAIALHYLDVMDEEIRHMAITDARVNEEAVYVREKPQDDENASQEEIVALLDSRTLAYTDDASETTTAYASALAILK